MPGSFGWAARPRPALVLGFLAAALAAGAWPALSAAADEPAPTAALETAAPTAVELETPQPEAGPTETALPASPAPSEPLTPTPGETIDTTPPPPETSEAAPAAETTAPAPTDAATPTPSAGPPSLEPETSTPTAEPTATADGQPLGPEAPSALNGLPSTSLIISQVYGGGGNTSAPYRNDFVELYNLGAVDVDLAGWSVQYASAAGASWQALPLAGWLPAGGFWLIALGSGGQAGEPLPPADAAFGLNLAASAGKVALVRQAGALAGACPSDAAIVDFVGYGAGANCAEGAPVAGTSNTLAARRISLSDSNQNSADFAALPPLPRPGGLAAATATPVGAPTGTPSEAAPTATFTAAAPPASPSPAPATATPTASPTPAAAGPGAVVVNEVVTDPQRDWGGGGFMGAPGSAGASDADEFVELLIGWDGLDLTGWQIALLDGSDVSGDLTAAGAFQASVYLGGGSFTATRAGDRLVLGNVRGSGSMTNQVTVVLSDARGVVIDRLRLGQDAPDGDAAGPEDEAVARRPDGSSAWARQPATPGASNDTAGPAPAGSATPAAATATATPTAAWAPGAVRINEVAWAGTAASSSDEWLELFNPGPEAVPLAGWSLSDDGDLTVVFPAGRVIAAQGYLLLERTDDAAVSDVPADLIYAGGLSNAGETLALRDPGGAVIDQVPGGAGWPAGDAETFATLERAGGGGWRTHAGAASGRDADGGPIAGTPRGPNSDLLPAPTPMPFSHDVRLNEFLPDPGPGGREFIELVNTGGAPADLSGWRLDDRPGASAPFALPPGTWLAAGGLAVFFQDETGVTLNNSGDIVRLLTPDGQAADEWAYSGSPGDGVSWARIPDGGAWSEQGAPSPGRSNGSQAVPPPGRPADRGSAPAAPAAAIGVLRSWPAGAWATIVGQVTVPPGVFGARLIYVQDATGGIAVYLGRGDWPPMQAGQSISILGYTRLRAGRLELYARNGYHIGLGGPDEPEAAPAAVQGAGPERAAQLVTLTGRVTRLEGSAFWLEAGAGPVRVFFAASSGVRRPRAARGDVWTVTGVVTELTATRTRAAGWQVQPRFARDLLPIQTRHPQPTALPTEPASPNP